MLPAITKIVNVAVRPFAEGLQIGVIPAKQRLTIRCARIRKSNQRVAQFADFDTDGIQIGFGKCVVIGGNHPLAHLGHNVVDVFQRRIRHG